MKLSFNWLKEYIDLPVSEQVLADKMTMAGLEVEDIMETGTNIPDGIIVAEIIERTPHPDAEKLSVCRVNTGSEELQIVCGAPNCNKGVKAPLATVGTVFIDTDSGKKFKIKKSKLRGVESFGMLCSSSELNLDGDHDGIMLLPDDSPVGTPLKKTLDSDTIYELEVTPNRSDWLSHWGVARDLVPLINQKTYFPEIPKIKPKSIENTDNLITVEEKDLCTRYTARIIRNVKVAESPDWLKQRLVSIGLRPINNIVDITNFVLMELGHPLHAFDLNLLTENRIIVRKAKKNEKIQTLDDSELTLNEDNLVICDAEKPVALAGIMGGKDSGVTENTTDILLESAVFNTSNIRATSRKTKISSDSSFRFERGVDWEMCETASDRATSLILEIAGGNLTTDLIDIKSEQPKMPEVNCRFTKIRSLLGANISNDEIIEIFKGLAFKVINITTESCQVVPPTYRLDIYREADLAEEVARIYGLDNIPVAPIVAASGGSITKDAYFKQQKLGDELISLGLNECMNYSLIHTDKALNDARFTKDDLIALKNPLSLELANMRPSLLAQMLETVERNISRKNTSLTLFETGRVFCATPKLYPEERFECCIAMTGLKHPERFSNEKKINYDFFDMKGIIESLFELKKLPIQFKKLTDNAILKNFKSGIASEIIMDGKTIGAFGEVNSSLTKGMRLNTPLFIALIDIDPIINRKPAKIRFKSIPAYPSTSRDIAFIADKTLEHGTILKTISSAKVKNLEKVELFDIFEDEKVFGSNKKSMAYSLTYRNSEKTLTDKEVNSAHDKLRSYMAQKLNIELR
jgi:phenylalanyl-tRNA synthetase beta chain